MKGKTLTTALVLGPGGALIAVTPQAQADAVCGTVAGHTVYVTAGRDVSCQQANEAMRRWVADEPLGWTCGGGKGVGAWCTSPPDARVELR
jgi:hypothetical protein